MVRSSRVRDLVRLATTIGVGACGGRIALDLGGASIEEAEPTTDGSLHAPQDDAHPAAEGGADGASALDWTLDASVSLPRWGQWCVFEAGGAVQNADASDFVPWDDSKLCGWFAPASCEALERDDGGRCSDICTGSFGCQWSYLPEGGQIGAYCKCVPGVGRAPAGLVLGATPPGSTNRVGAALAELAMLESASVPAFEVLAEELADLGAPPALVARARTAADEERDHARRMGALASAFGGLPVDFSLADRRARDVESIAVENMVEGCVRETFGALVGAVQARRAPDPRIRSAFAAIADDEARHAELSWDVASFLGRRLDAARRGRVAGAAGAALRALREEALAAPHDDVAVALGLPTPAERALLVDALAEALAAAAPSPLAKAVAHT